MDSGSGTSQFFGRGSLTQKWKLGTGKDWELLGVEPLAQLIWSPPGRVLDKLAREGSHRDAVLYPQRKSVLSRDKGETPGSS